MSGASAEDSHDSRINVSLSLKLLIKECNLAELPYLLLKFIDQEGLDPELLSELMILLPKFFHALR